MLLYLPFISSIITNILDTPHFIAPANAPETHINITDNQVTTIKEKNSDSAIIAYDSGCYRITINNEKLCLNGNTIIPCQKNGHKTSNTETKEYENGKELCWKIRKFPNDLYELSVFFKSESCFRHLNFINNEFVLDNEDKDRFNIEKL